MYNVEKHENIPTPDEIELKRLKDVRTADESRVEYYVNRHHCSWPKAISILGMRDPEDYASYGLQCDEYGNILKLAIKVSYEKIMDPESMIERRVDELVDAGVYCPDVAIKVAQAEYELAYGPIKKAELQISDSSETLAYIDGFSRQRTSAEIAEDGIKKVRAALHEIGVDDFDVQ